MKLVETKCPNCNSNIEVESNRRRAECQYCGTKFVLDDNTVNVKHISAGGISEEQEYINAETYLNKFRNYDEAYKLYLSLSRRFVDNPEVWIGLLRSMTHDFTYKINTKLFQKNCTMYWNNFCSLVDKSEVDEYLGKYRNYLDNVAAVSTDFTNNINLENVKNIATNSNKELIMLLVTIFVGAYGVHKFIEGKIGMGVLYLFTGGLFGIGWIIDVIVAIKNLVNASK